MRWKRDWRSHRCPVAWVPASTQLRVAGESVVSLMRGGSDVRIPPHDYGLHFKPILQNRNHFNSKSRGGWSGGSGNSAQCFYYCCCCCCFCFCLCFNCYCFCLANVSPFAWAKAWLNVKTCSWIFSLVVSPSDEVFAKVTLDVMRTNLGL